MPAARLDPHPAVRVAWFGVVGLLATAVHYLVVVALVGWGGWRPVPANVIGWLVAFLFSFTGHYFKTFHSPGLPAGPALRRFFAISALGFVANQSAYALLLRYTSIRYDVAVIVVSFAVAAMTYVLGRHWAFRPVGASGQTRASWLTRAVLGAHVVAVLFVASTGWQKPMGNWDIIPYAALVHEDPALAPQALSRLTYQDVGAYLGEARALGMASDPYGGAVQRDPAALLDTMKLYEVKPLYIFLSRLALPLTGNAAAATVLVSAAALALLLAPLPFFFRRPLLAVAAVWLFLLAGDPQFALLASASSPDSLALLFAVASALAALRSHAALAAVAALLAVLARPDAAFAVVPLLVALAWLRRRQSRPLLLLGAAAAALALFAYLGTKALPWTTLFSHTFLMREAFPSRIAYAFSLADYLAVVRRTVHVLLEPRPLLYGAAALLLVALPWLRERRFGEPQALAVVALLNVAAHYAIFPVDEFAHERMFLASYLFVIVAGLLEWDRGRSCGGLIELAPPET